MFLFLKCISVTVARIDTNSSGKVSAVWSSGIDGSGVGFEVTEALVEGSVIVWVLLQPLYSDLLIIGNSNVSSMLAFFAIICT